MAENKKPERDDEEQSERFIDTAKKIEAEQSKLFEEAMQAILKKPKPS